MRRVHPYTQEDFKEIQWLCRELRRRGFEIEKPLEKMAGEYVRTEKFSLKQEKKYPLELRQAALVMFLEMYGEQIFQFSKLKIREAHETNESLDRIVPLLGSVVTGYLLYYVDNSHKKPTLIEYLAEKRRQAGLLSK